MRILQIAIPTVEVRHARLAFVVDRNKPGYTGRLGDQQIVSIALKACGHYGTCADYLVRTAASLEHAGIADPRLSRLARLVTEAADGQT